MSKLLGVVAVLFEVDVWDVWELLPRTSLGFLAPEEIDCEQDAAVTAAGLVD